MITSCTGCRQQIRDCSAIEVRGDTHATVRGWYHTATGRTECKGGKTMASPVPLVDVTCRHHPHKLREDCLLCYTSMQVSQYFHELGRCIPRLCPWPHVH